MRCKIPEIGFPENVEIGPVLLEGGFAREALPYLETAASNRGNANDLTNLAICHRNLMRMDSALSYAQKAVKIEPNNVPAWHNLGIIREDFGQFQEAEEAYGRALDLNNLVSFVQQGVCYCRMRRGMFLDQATQQLWHVHRWWAVEMPELRRWEGQPLKNKDIIVWREGGAGDHILFLRYLKLLKDQGARVTLFGLKQHRSLLTGHPWVDRWMDTDEEFNSEEFDFQVSLFSIPAITKQWPLPMHTAYLFAPKLSRSGEFTVGLCLKAGEKSKNNRISRSVPAELAELLHIPGIRFVSLQRDPLPNWVEPHKEENSNWRDTADLIGSCDVIISVDTAIAHMAGAMGKAVWTILPLNSDWRWFIDKADSPWYPTMRLFRNRHVSDFRETVEEVGAALLEYASDPSRAREQAVAMGVR